MLIVYRQQIMSPAKCGCKLCLGGLKWTGNVAWREILNVTVFVFINTSVWAMMKTTTTKKNTDLIFKFLQIHFVQMN